MPEISEDELARLRRLETDSGVHPSQGAMVTESEYAELQKFRAARDASDKVAEAAREAMGPPTHRIYTADGQTADMHMVPTHYNDVPVVTAINI